MVKKGKQEEMLPGEIVLDRIKNRTIRNHTIQMDGYYNSKEREVTEERQFRKFLRCKTGCIVNDISKKAGAIYSKGDIEYEFNTKRDL